MCVHLHFIFIFDSETDMQVSKESLSYSLEAIPSVPLHKINVYFLLPFTTGTSTGVQWITFSGGTMVLNAITNAKNIGGPSHSTTVTKCTKIINLYSWHIELWLNLNIWYVCWVSMCFHHHRKGHVPCNRFQHIIYIANDVFASSDVTLYMWQSIKTAFISWLSIPM